MNKAEKYVSIINTNAFFKEFSYSHNKFKTPDKQTHELADSFVWLGDFLFIFQIKDRQDSTGGSEEDWFKNKILKTAVKQIKNSIRYLKEYDEIPVTNQRGHKINVAEARKLDPHKIIVYNPNKDFSESLRFKKFHKSSTHGYIHLFHTEDYYWICKFLLTPFEIEEYFTFRERLYSQFPSELDKLPEQYVLGHYIESIETDHLNPEYIANVKNLQSNIDDFDISYLVENFNNKIIQNPDSRDYYLIIQELAKLNRSDLKQFKLRYMRALEKAKENVRVVPYRIVSVYSECGFAFIPLEYEYKENWKNALTTYVEAHKYDQGLDKCIGMIVYYEPAGKYYDVNWVLIESTWEQDDEFAKLIEEQIPLRKVKVDQGFRYTVKR